MGLNFKIKKIRKEVKVDLVQFLVYLMRWQLSFVIMYPTMLLISFNNYAIKLIIANLVGGFFFYYIDKYILAKRRFVLDKSVFKRYNISIIYNLKKIKERLF